MWNVSGQKPGRTINHTAHPVLRLEKPCNIRGFRGLIFHSPAPFFPHVRPLLLPKRRLAAGWGTVPLPPASRDGPSADRAGPGRYRPLGKQGGLQRRIKGQHRLPEIAAIGPRPAFPQHITFTRRHKLRILRFHLRRKLTHSVVPPLPTQIQFARGPQSQQAAILPVIVGAPARHQRPDRRLFLTGQFTGLLQSVTSHGESLSAVPGNRTHRGCPASRDSGHSGSPWGPRLLRRFFAGRFFHFTFIKAGGKIHSPSPSSQGGVSSYPSSKPGSGPSE